MKEEEYPFTGMWYVAVQEARTAGKWKREYEFAPGEWIIGFTPKGNYIEINRPDSEDRCIYEWIANQGTGVISVVLPANPETVILKCVFGNEFLYHYDEMPHIPENADTIVDHHSHLRLKLVRIGKSEN